MYFTKKTVVYWLIFYNLLFLNRQTTLNLSIHCNFTAHFTGQLVNITGGIILASGVVAYLAAFDAFYRLTSVL